MLDEICSSKLEQGSSVLALLCVCEPSGRSVLSTLPHRASVGGGVPAGNCTNADILWLLEV